MQNNTLDSLENKVQELLQELREYDYYSPYQEILQDLEDVIQEIIKMQNEQFEFDKKVQEHDIEDFKNHIKTSLKLTPYEFHKIQTWDGFICKENGVYMYKGHKIEVI